MYLLEKILIFQTFTYDLYFCLTVVQVIASMTVGKDVSALFPDVVNCMQTDNLELKKLVYLYLMNYAKSQPDMAIMAVNTFVKVCKKSYSFIVDAWSGDSVV